MPSFSKTTSPFYHGIRANMEVLRDFMDSIARQTLEDDLGPLDRSHFLSPAAHDLFQCFFVLVSAVWNWGFLGISISSLPESYLATVYPRNCQQKSWSRIIHHS